MSSVPARGEEYKIQSHPDLLQGELFKAATPKEVGVYLSNFKFWANQQCARPTEVW